MWGAFPIRTHIEVPGYGGSWSLNLSTIDGGTNLPPRKWWGPLNFFAQSFGAVKDTYNITMLCVQDTNLSITFYSRVVLSKYLVQNTLSETYQHVRLDTFAANISSSTCHPDGISIETTLGNFWCVWLRICKLATNFRIKSSKGDLGVPEHNDEFSFCVILQ